jgi:hypothetical protein
MRCITERGILICLDIGTGSRRISIKIKKFGLVIEKLKVLEK